MSKSISWQLIFWWVTFSSFHFFQQRHWKYFQGASRGFCTFLGLFVTASTIAWFGFIGWYWYNTVWHQALTAAAISFGFALGVTTAVPTRWEFGMSLSGSCGPDRFDWNVFHSVVAVSLSGIVKKGNETV